MAALAMKHDDAEFYFIDFPPDLPQENGGRHIALFLAWAITRGLSSSALAVHAEALRAGALDPVELLFEECDGKLLSDDLSDIGDAFAVDRYDGVPHWLGAVMRLDPGDEAFFRREPTPADAAAFMQRVDVQYADWRAASGRGLPDRAALRAAARGALDPLLAGAGFVEACETDSDVEREIHTFERSITGGRQMLMLHMQEWGFGFNGVGVEVSLDLPSFHDHVVAEKNKDLGWYSGIEPSVAVPFERIRGGWPGPTAYGSRFWVFDEAQLAALAAHLADRMASWVLPLLHTIDGIEGLARAYATPRLADSPLYRPHDPYPALLAAERARHPRLQELLDEAGERLQATPPEAQTDLQRGALHLIERVRARSAGHDRN